MRNRGGNIVDTKIRVQRPIPGRSSDSRRDPHSQPSRRTIGNGKEGEVGREPPRQTRKMARASDTAAGPSRNLTEVPCFRVARTRPTRHPVSLDEVSTSAAGLSIRWRRHRVGRKMVAAKCSFFQKSAPRPSVRIDQYCPSRPISHQQCAALGRFHLPMAIQMLPV